MSDKCEICRNSCKDNGKEDCKFYPKDCFIGYPVHFKEAPDKHYGKPEATSRICVVCKGYFNYKNIKWIKYPSGYYSFCPECHVGALYSVQNTKKALVG